MSGSQNKQFDLLPKINVETLKIIDNTAEISA